MVYRRDFRTRVRALIPLLFFAAGGLRIFWRGGMTEVERWILQIGGAVYAAALAVVWVLEGRRAVVTDERGLERRGRGRFRVAWAEVEELRERYQAERLLGMTSLTAGLELVTPAGSYPLDGGWRGYPALVRECAERTTEAIVARLEPQLAAGVTLVFGAVTVAGDAVLLQRKSGKTLRIAVSEISGLRLHQGWLVLYLKEGTRAAKGWIARRLGELTNPYALIELLLRHGAGRSPGAPPPDLGQAD